MSQVTYWMWHLPVSCFPPTLHSQPQGRGVIDQLVRVVRPPQPAVEALVQTSNVGPLKPPELPRYVHCGPVPARKSLNHTTFLEPPMPFVHSEQNEPAARPPFQ